MTPCRPSSSSCQEGSRRQPWSVSKRLALARVPPLLSPACDTHLVVTISAHLCSPLASLQCCGDATWGDWRPHLAVMLSNKVGDMDLNHRAIITMGDSLGEPRLL